MKNLLKRLSVVTLLGGLFLNTGATSILAQEEEQSFEGEQVTVGVVGDSGVPSWELVAQKALEQEGIELEVVIFTDYNQPNEALANGSIDLNSYQHVIYLEEWNEANDQDLQPIAYTLVTPLGVYSDKYASIEEIPENAQIAIPNDPTNGGRALLALELAGLIEVDDEAGPLATVRDVTDNPLNIEFIELDSSQIALSLPDIDAGVINTGHANDAGLTVHEDAIFVDVEDIENINDYYRNVIAARSEDAENPLYAKIVELYQQEDTAQVILESSAGGSIPAWEGYVYEGYDPEASGSEESGTEESSSEE